jgi:hypothetical protein
LYCVYDAKNIIHIIQRRQHGLVGWHGRQEDALLSLTSTFKKTASRDEYFFFKTLLPFTKIKSILCVRSPMCFYYYFPYLKQTITILPAYGLGNSFRKSPLSLKPTSETRPCYVHFGGFLHPIRDGQRDNQPMTDEVIICMFQ